MNVNRDKPDRWKADTATSVDLYNRWFLEFAPETYRDTRMKIADRVEQVLGSTDYLRNVRPGYLLANPDSIMVLRMCTAPPLARDRIVGLAGISKSVLNNLEKHNRMPPRLKSDWSVNALDRLIGVIRLMLDTDIFPWLKTDTTPSGTDVDRAASIVADRLCGTLSDPIIKNAQEKRQLHALTDWLVQRGFAQSENRNYDQMRPGSFADHVLVLGQKEDSSTVNIPIDMVIIPRSSADSTMPLLIEAKSAGDFTNTNKRRKEEATKIQQLRREHGDVRFILMLGGYFDSQYLGYEAAEGIDWFWEHRIDDLIEFRI